MVDMEPVRQFNSELSTIYETKPPISKGKVASITRLAVKAIKYYKHVVQSVEKFTQKCRQEYKVPALYIIDSIIRQSRHQFGADKDVFGPRFGKGIATTFQHLYKCPVEDQGKIVKVLNLWQKGGVYPPEVVQPLLNMAKQSQNQVKSEPPESMDTAPLTLHDPSVDIKPAIPHGNGNFVSVLQQQQQQHLEQIEQLRRQLQEQQNINQQQQQQLAQQQIGPGDPLASVPSMSNQPMQFQSPQLQQGIPQEVMPGQAMILPGSQPQEGVLQGNQPSDTTNEQPRFQLQPHVLAQIQALTGMNIRLPQPNQGEVQGLHENQQQPSNVTDQKALWAHPGMGQPAVQPVEGVVHGKEQNMIDDFDYGDEQDDATRLAEQRRHLMEEERRLSQEQMSSERDRHRDRSPRRRSQSPYSRRNRSPRRRSRSPRRRSRSPRGERSRRDRSRERGRDRGREREEEKPDNKGPPPIVKDSCSVCSSTVWVGHLAKSVQQEDLKEVFADYGEVTSIDMVPPRGCAYVQMSKREEAIKAVSRLSNLRLHSNNVKLAWAPASGVKDRKYKEYFNVELGVTYIPWDVLGSTPDLKALAEGGWIDPESLPAELKESLKASGEKETEAKPDEQANPLANQVLPPQIPTHLPPPGHPMFQMMPPPHMMMRPPFPGGPNMLPPDGPPWAINIQQRPPGFNPAVPPPHGVRQTGSSSFPFNQTSGDNQPTFHPRLHPLHVRGQEPSGMHQHRPRFRMDGPRGPIGGPRGQTGQQRDHEGHHNMGDAPPRDFEGPPRGGPHGDLRGPPPRGHIGGPDGPRGPPGLPLRQERPRFDGPPRGPEGHLVRHNRPRFGPRGPEGPLIRQEGPRFDGPMRGQERPPFAGHPMGPAMEGPPRGLESPNIRLEGPPGRGLEGPRGPDGLPISQEGSQDGPQEPHQPESGVPRNDSSSNHEDGVPDGPSNRFEGPPRERPHGFDGPPRGPEVMHRGPEGMPVRPEFLGPHGGPPRHWGPSHDRPMGGPPPMGMPVPEWQRGPPRKPSFDEDAQLPPRERGNGPNEHGPRYRREREERPPWDRRRDRDRDRDRDEERSRSREQDRERQRSRDRDRTMGRDRDRDRPRSRDRELERSRERDRSRDRDNWNSRDSDRSDRDRDRRDRDRRDRDRAERDRPERDRPERDRRRSFSDRDSRSSDGEKSDRQIKSEPIIEAKTVKQESENQSSNSEHQQNDLSVAVKQEPLMEVNNASPEEGELVEDSISTQNNQNPRINDTKLMICEAKIKSEPELNSIADDAAPLNKRIEEASAEIKLEMKQEVKEEVTSS